MPERNIERRIHVGIEEIIYGKRNHATDNCAKGNCPEGK